MPTSMHPEMARAVAKELVAKVRMPFPSDTYSPTPDEYDEGYSDALDRMENVLIRFFGGGGDVR